MRVISGKAKAKKLKTIKGLKTRPTTDFVKESIFSIIGERVYDANVLDLYAGSGALGIEALSRGAKFAFFIDNSGAAVKVIKENLFDTGLIDLSKIFKTDVKVAMKRLSKQDLKFDIIFMDPPYNEFNIIDLQKIQDNDILNKEGILVLEHEKDCRALDVGRWAEDQKSGLELFYSKDYGRTVVSFFRNCREEEII